LFYILFNLIYEHHNMLYDLGMLP